MNDSDKLSRIIKLELEITEAIIKGHKPNTDDKFKNYREELAILRKQLNLVRKAQGTGL